MQEFCPELFEGIASHVMTLDIAPAPQELESRHRHDQFPARPADPLHLANRFAIVIDMFQHVDGNNDVELRLSVRQSSGVREAD